MKAFRFSAIATFLTALLAGVHAYGQGSVQQAGPVTSYHAGVWLQNGFLTDGGTPGSPQLNSLGLFNGASCPFGISSQTNPGLPPLSYSLFTICQTNGVATISTTAPTLQFSINGTIVPFSGSGVPSIAGTANQITETGSPGATTLSLPTNIIPPGTINGNAVPASSDTFTLNAATQTLTNKTINGTNNTLTVRLPSDVTGILPSANGGAGSINGILQANGSGLTSAVTIGSGLNYSAGTLTASGSGGSVTSVATGAGLTGGPITNSGTIAETQLRCNSGADITGATYTVNLTPPGDLAAVCNFTGSSGSAWTLGAGVAGEGFDVVDNGTANITITATGNINGASTLVLTPGQSASIFYGTSTWWAAVANPTVTPPAGSSGDLQMNSGSSTFAAAHLNDTGSRINATESIDTETNAIFWEIPNASVTGTTNNKLAIFTGAPSTAVIANTGNLTGIIGIVATGGGTTGTAKIAVSGQATCVFDGATVAGDFVQASGTAGGDCHDAGATDPTGVAVIGQVLSTNGGAGTYAVMLYPPNITQLGTTGNPGGGNGGLSAHGSPSAGSLTGWFSSKALESTDLSGDCTTSGTFATTCTTTNGASIAALQPSQWFGDGSDGNVTCSSGTTLARDMYYNNLTISSGCNLVPGTPTVGVWRIFVAGTLDISAAPAAGISVNGIAGGNATTVTGGAAQNCLSAGSTTGTVTAPVAGSNGGTGAGSTNPGNAASLSVMGGVSGASGAGGAVGGTAGGSSKAAAATQASPGQTGAFEIRGPTTLMSAWSGNTGVNATWVKAQGGQAGPGGSSGAGDGTGSGGGGGAGGCPAPILALFAHTIARGTNSTAGIISAKGGNGGAGASGNSGTGTNHGGGGGGSGGGGGWIYLIYQTLTGSTITNCLDATGGGGGAGANGLGTGVGGDSGQPGGGGRIQVFNIGAGTNPTFVGPSAAGTANSHSGSTGGSAATATAQQANLFLPTNDNDLAAANDDLPKFLMRARP